MIRVFIASRSYLFCMYISEIFFVLFFSFLTRDYKISTCEILGILLLLIISVFFFEYSIYFQKDFICVGLILTVERHEK